MGAILNAIINAAAAVFGFLCGYAWYEDSRKKKKPAEKPEKKPQKPPEKEKILADWWTDKRITALDKRVARIELVHSIYENAKDKSVFTPEVVAILMDEDSKIETQIDPVRNERRMLVTTDYATYELTDNGWRTRARWKPYEQAVRTVRSHGV